jgi:hypothetical protein
MRHKIGVLSFALLAVPAAAAQAQPSPALGQIVNWVYWPHPTTDFVWNKNQWTPSNAAIVFHKLYAGTAVKCDVMLDAETTTTGAVFAGLFVDGANVMAQGLAGAPAQPRQKGLITFGFSNLFGLTAGNHNFVLEVSVEDGSTVSFTTTELGIQCYEMVLPPSQ